MPEPDQNAIDRLKEILPKGTMIFTTVVHHVKKSGNMVVMVLIAKEGEVINLSDDISDAIPHLKWNRRCGVWSNDDYGIVHKLGNLLYGDGYAFGHRRL